MKVVLDMDALSLETLIALRKEVYESADDLVQESTSFSADEVLHGRLAGEAQAFLNLCIEIHKRVSGSI